MRNAAIPIFSSKGAGRTSWSRCRSCPGSHAVPGAMWAVGAAQVRRLQAAWDLPTLCLCLSLRVMPWDPRATKMLEHNGSFDLKAMAQAKLEWGDKAELVSCWAFYTSHDKAWLWFSYCEVLKLCWCPCAVAPHVASYRPAAIFW